MVVKDLIKNNKYLLFILLLALLLRAFTLTTLPLYGDELTLVYDAYSVLQTGQDQTGETLPLTFSMGAGRPGGYIYFSLPFVAIFGPTALGIRTLSLISGLGLIVLIYLLAAHLFSKKVGLVSALLLAVNPWDLSLSRGGFEAHFALFLAVSGIYSLILGVKKGWFLVLSALCFGLVIHVYPTYKLTLPLFFLPLIYFIGIKQLFAVKIRKYLISGAVIILLFSGLSFYQTFFSGSEERFSKINFLSDDKLKQQLVQKIEKNRNLDSLPGLKPLFHNKTIEYAFVYLESYLNNLSFDFLFLRGDGNPRHNMATQGGFYIIEIVSIFFGFLYVYRFKKTFIFLLGWVLITPLATAFILLPHALRNSFMIIPIVILSAVGFILIWDFLNRSRYTWFKLILPCILFLQFLFFADRFYFLSPVLYERFWSAPAKAAVKIAFDNKNDYQLIYLSDKIDSVEFALPVYFWQDPKEVINQNKDNPKLFNTQVKKFDNIYIGSFGRNDFIDLVKRSNQKGLYIDVGRNIKDGNESSIYGKDGLEDLIITKIN